MDIRVHPRADFRLEELAALAKEFEVRYPQTKDMFQITARLAVGQDASHSTERVKAGLQFLGASSDRLFNAQVDGWSFSKLAPYEDWETLQKEAREVWLAYKAIARPERLTRVAVRYVNRIDLPLPVEDFKTYLQTVPEVGSGLPQGLSHFFMQLQIPHEDLKALLILNQAMAEPAREGVASIILDFDLFRTVDVPQDDDAMWTYFDQLRIAKNRAFEASITDATRELFR